MRRQKGRKRDVTKDRLSETSDQKTVTNENFLFSAGQRSNKNVRPEKEKFYICFYQYVSFKAIVYFPGGKIYYLREDDEKIYARMAN